MEVVCAMVALSLCKLVPSTSGRTQMGLDGSKWILTSFFLLGLVEVHLVPAETHGFKGLGPDINSMDVWF